METPILELSLSWTIIVRNEPGAPPPFFTHQQSYFEWQIHEMSPVQIAPWHGWYSPMGLFISPSGLLRSLKLLGLLLGFLQLISLRLPSGNQFHGWKITTSMVFAAIDHLFRWCSIISFNGHWYGCFLSLSCLTEGDGSMNFDVNPLTHSKLDI
jgi:hypothetical protein